MLGNHSIVRSLVLDLLSAMLYLHDSELRFHGNLKSPNCLVDSNWVLKVSDFGMSRWTTQDCIDFDAMPPGCFTSAASTAKCLHFVWLVVAMFAGPDQSTSGDQFSQ